MSDFKSDCNKVETQDYEAPAFTETEERQVSDPCILHVTLDDMMKNLSIRPTLPPPV